MPASIRFLLDEHVPRAVVAGLRQRGIVALRLVDLGLMGQPDELLLERARLDGLVFFTHDSDFLELHAAGRPHTGIVFAPRHAGVGAMVIGLTLIASVFSADEMAGRLEFLPWQFRHGAPSRGTSSCRQSAP